MRLHTLLTPETIRIGLSASNKRTAISSTVDLLAAHPAISDLDKVRNAVFEREDQMSTGVGKGVGLPHAKSTGATANVAALALLKNGLDFDAIDSEDVHILFLLVGPPESKSQHIRILSRFSRLMNRKAFRDDLKSQTSVDSILRMLKDEENQMGG